jgi:HTH-type transcriptional regulator / antitoxin HigA
MPSRLSPIRARSVAPAKPKYLALVRKFPLRPIRSEEENEAALALLGSLAERQREGALTPEEHDYIAVLGKLIEEYENAQYPRGPVTGSAMLAHLIEARGISQAQLAADTGIPESTVSGLVRGSRPLGRKQIQILARYFGVDAALLQDG